MSHISTSSTRVENAAGTLSPLSPSEAADVASDSPTSQPVTQDQLSALLAGMAALKDQVAAMGKDKDALIQLAAKQAQELADRSFYEHIIGGRGGIDPTEDDSIKLETCEDGRQRVWIGVWMNTVPKRGKTNQSRIPMRDAKGNLIKDDKGQTRYLTFTNYDLGRTMIRESPVTVRTKTGPVTITGMAIINVGRDDAETIETRSARRDQLEPEQLLGDKETSADGTELTGSDSDVTPDDGQDATEGGINKSHTSFTSDLKGGLD